MDKRKHIHLHNITLNIKFTVAKYIKCKTQSRKKFKN